MSESGPATRVFTVQPDESDLRLDRFLVARCDDLSRNQIQAAISQGQVQAEGCARHKNYRVRAGDEVVLTPLAVVELTARPQDIPLDIAYEDDDLVVVNKPAGLVVHPAPGHPDGTLVNALLYRYRDLAGGDDPLRPGIVHRLDRETTGLLVVAMHNQAHRALADQLRRRTLKRIYRVLSWGHWRNPEGVLAGAIGRHRRDRLRMAVLEAGGRDATTHYQVTEDFEFVQYCRVELETGRTHQIRVHFAHHGHPVVGDDVYGDGNRARNVPAAVRQRAGALARSIGRQALHAAELHLIHPVTGRELKIEADLPADLQNALAILRR